MPDTIGNITVPSITPSGTFALAPDYGYGRIHAPEVVVHQIGNASANLKVEQRFLLGTGAKRFLWRRSLLCEADRVTLRNFWENTSGGLGAFTYNVPDEAGTGTTAFTVRFENAPLSWEFVSQAASTIGLVFVEIPSDGSAPSYTLNSTQTRFPSGGLMSGLLSQVQQMIPLVKIVVTEPGYPAIYLSDRRCTIGGQLYLARLLDWDGIEQGISGEADAATFTFGNADRVMRSLANDTDLWRASVEFSLFHVGSGIKLDLWKGEVSDWRADAGPLFQIRATDGLYELGLPYPARKISRTCWKDFNDGAACPAASAGGTNLGTPCDKGFDTAAGCVFHTMQNYFGGVIAVPQAVRTKDNSTGTWGFSRSPLTSVSLIADSVYDQVLPEVYTDQGFPVNGKIVAGRDEGDFYTALAVVSKGPIGSFGVLDRSGPPATTIGSTLDGQPNHGPGNLGLRRGHGHDPVINNDPDQDSDKFSLGQGGAGIQTYGTQKAAGVAFIEIRRSDEKGLQLSRLAEHSLQAIVGEGLSGFKWTAPGSRSTVVLTNPVWVAINAFLTARNLQYASAGTQEAYFDVAAAVAAAAICDTSVSKIIGSGSETQFKFVGVIQEEKPLRDWITEILMNCLGFWVNSFGKLKIGIRVNSSVVESFTEGNIIHGSLQLAPIRPGFNHLTANFADAEFEFVGNSVTVYDMDHAKRIGGAASPLFLKSALNLSGCVSKSQAARIIAVRNREELGGIYRAGLAKPYLEYAAARQISFKTTVLALGVEAGMICSLTHEEMPTYQASNDGQSQSANYGEFRVTRWRLNKDYSIDIEGRSTHNDMYDLVVGPKPADVAASVVPNEDEFAPADWNFEAFTSGDGKLRLKNFTCATNAGTIHLGFFEVFHVPEAELSQTHLLADMSSGATSFTYNGDPITPGDHVLIDSEIMLVTAVNVTSPFNGTATVIRAQLGTSAAAHTISGAAVVASVSADSKAEFVVSTGLPAKSGAKITRVSPAGNPGILASYNSSTGAATSVLPFASLSAGNSLSFDTRVYRVISSNEVITFQPRFFRSPNRADFEHVIDLPFAGVVAVRGTLENTRGIRSDDLIKVYTAAFPHRLRTLGTTAYTLTHPELPAGANSDLFESIKTVHSQAMDSAFAEVISNGAAGTPIAAPRTVAAVNPSTVVVGGTITIAGTISAAGRIAVIVGNGTTDFNWIEAPVFTLTTETTATQVATALAAWLNADDQFASFLLATSSGAVVSLTDLTGIGGVVTTEVSGGVTATVAGSPSGTAMKSQLGIVTGRKYAISFQDTTHTLESDLSPLSESTGPTGGATKIDIRQLPISPDSRVNRRRIWATPDGADSAFYLVATVTDNATEEAQDEVAEASLTGGTAWPGATQPAQDGLIKITVKRDKAPYCELRIPTAGGRSNVIDGLALLPLAEGALLTADVDNQSGQTPELKIVLQ